MNRTANNILFWTITGILGFVFVVTLLFGSIKTIWGAGTSVYNVASDIITGIGLNKSDFFKWSPFFCIGAGLLLTLMFYRKFNTRIN